MSLLIKALATAEKDKQKASKPERKEPFSADMLELSPLELPSDVAADEAIAVDAGAEKQSAHVALSTEQEPSQDHNQPADHEPSLAEEAGLLNASSVRKESVAARASNPAAPATAQQKNKAGANSAVTPQSAGHKDHTANIAKENNQRVAAGAFVANQAAKPQSSRSALILLGVAGALLILLGLYGYQYFQTLMTDDVVVVKPTVAPPVSSSVSEQAPPPATVMNEGVLDGNMATDAVAPNTTAESTATAGTAVVGSEPGAEPDAMDARIKSQLNAYVEKNSGEKPVVGKQSASQELSKQQAVEASLPAPVVASAKVQAAAETSSPRKDRMSAQQEPLKLVSKTNVAGVDPTLLAAYEAFSRGDDRLAQQRYRQVLQKDVRNIDALLGMAAIAQRQNRIMDAIGWYRKVTEIEPRNSIAQSAIADLEASTDVVGAESRIKSLLVRQPDAANLHAALGNLYAEQNQWSAAQSAYFNASQYAPASADYAFNLAISLEHLGKPELALAQYQRALSLLNASGAISPDRAQLEARIQALQ